MILAGDIGGTNTRLALFEDDLTLTLPAQKFKTGKGTDLEAHIRQTMAQGHRPVTRACLAVAGPVIEGVCRSTNIGRTFVATEIADAVGLKSVTLINDLAANASGIERLTDSEIVPIIEGEGRRGTRAVCSPGTGLGEGLLIFDGQYHRAYPSEGGHSRFAPTTPDEEGLLAFLRNKLGDVITEHVVSGPGIGHIFDYYVSTGRKPSDAVQAKLATPGVSRGSVISEAALAGSCDVCSATMGLFVHALAVEAASLAVKSFAIGGIYLGGGIPPKIVPLLKADAFRQAFVTHITMRPFLERVPVRVILNDDTALEGAALYARRFG